MPAKKTLHLICNAHLDPVWLWEWEEGAAEAISTFRTAAELCEQHDTFVFNHNEVVLYEWVQQYEPALFERIRKLVQAGRWHIMGGWYLQPDCNMPSGESFVRQILLGRQYFREHFGVTPTTAINFDPFGHSRGLAQILAKAGYDSYLFGRPGAEDCQLPAEEFVWVGYDGSEIMGIRFPGWYNSLLGQARRTIEERMAVQDKRHVPLVLWGVGNHGGGPSRRDVGEVNALIAENDQFDIRHSSPEAAFAELKQRWTDLPRHAGDINPWAVGCYTSMIRIKQKHRRLENELYATEKMVTAAAAQKLIEYPQAELAEATRDLAFVEFHDILPGSSIQPAEEASLRRADHGLELLSRAKTRAFMALAAGQAPARTGEIPILVYNPHPYKVRAIVECEFNLPDQNHRGTFTLCHVHRGERALPSQTERELSNIPLDWRKRVVFAADLAPSQMNRFDCKLEEVKSKPARKLRPNSGGQLRFRGDELDVIINTRTGLVDRYRVQGVDHVRPRAFVPVVMADNEDPWGMRQDRFGKVAGRFKLLNKREAAWFAGLGDDARLDAVRVIEDGPVRTVVEALFGFGHSHICQRYKLPKHGSEMEVETRVHWQEKSRMLKLEVPAPGENCQYLGQVAYGVAGLPSDGGEAVAQKWIAVVDKAADRCLTCINDGIYGSDYAPGRLRLTLLRSPGYAAHPIEDRPIMAQDRYSPRIDQGERLFRLWFNGGSVNGRLRAVDREALAQNERPMALSFYPPGGESRLRPFVTLSDNAVQMAALKKAESGPDIIVRLFEPTGRKRQTILGLPTLGKKKSISLKPFEIKTLRVNSRSGAIRETDLLERGGA